MFDLSDLSAAGRLVADGARWIGKQTVAAADWTAQKASDAYGWSALELQQAENWAAGAAKSGVRGATSWTADKGYDLVGEAASGVQSAERAFVHMANSISDAARSVKKSLFGQDPSQPCIPCRQAADKAKADAALKTDVGADGCLMTAGCQPLCKQGAKLTADELQSTRANPVTPTTGNACCQQKRAAWAAQDTPVPAITYVNGINTTRQDHCATLQAIANQKCANVIGVYNATEGFASDAIQTSQDRLLIKAANEDKGVATHDGRNPAVDTLSDLIYQDLKNNGSSTVYCHSQGGAVTSLASYDALNSLDLSGQDYDAGKLQVTSFGSAAPYWPSGIAATHYVNVNDMTPFAFGLGDNPASDSAGHRAPR